MFKRIKRAVAAVMLTLAIMLGLAAAAQAVTYGSPQKWQTGGTYCPVMMYANYNGWEEWVLRKVDGWELQYYAYC